MEELRTRHQQFCAAGGSALKDAGQRQMYAVPKGAASCCPHSARPRPVQLFVLCYLYPTLDYMRVSSRKLVVIVSSS